MLLFSKRVIAFVALVVCCAAEASPLLDVLQGAINAINRCNNDELTRTRGGTLEFCREAFAQKLLKLSRIEESGRRAAEWEYAVADVVGMYEGFFDGTYKVPYSIHMGMRPVCKALCGAVKALQERGCSHCPLVLGLVLESLSCVLSHLSMTLDVSLELPPHREDAENIPPSEPGSLMGDFRAPKPTPSSGSRASGTPHGDAPALRVRRQPREFVF